MRRAMRRKARSADVEALQAGNSKDSGVAVAVSEGESSLGEAVEGYSRSLLEALEAVRKGDLSRRLDATRGDIFGELGASYNSMVEMLNGFSGEVPRVAGEVGTEGKLGGQAKVEGVSGVWKQLTDNVNTMAGNLTEQVRNIALVATAISAGDLTQKITVEAVGAPLHRRLRVPRHAVVPFDLENMGSMGEVVAEGTVDEKRRFLRMFVRKVELDPTTGTGRAEICDLPLFGRAQKRRRTAKGTVLPLFLMVAGARYVVEKKIPGRRIDFECLEYLCRLTAGKAILLAAA